MRIHRKQTDRTSHLWNRPVHTLCRDLLLLTFSVAPGNVDRHHCSARSPQYPENLSQSFVILLHSPLYRPAISLNTFPVPFPLPSIFEVPAYGYSPIFFYFCTWSSKFSRLLAQVRWADTHSFVPAAVSGQNAQSYPFKPISEPSPPFCGMVWPPRHRHDTTNAPALASSANRAAARQP